MHCASFFNLAHRLLLIVAGFYFFTSCTSTSKFGTFEANEEIIRKIDSLCMLHSEKGNFPGLAIAVKGSKKRSWSRGYGYADLQAKRKIDPENDLFRIGSISKSVTATALGKLIEQGVVHPDVPISTYYADCPEDKRNLTLRQIGGHLAGIRHYRGAEFLSNISYDNVIDPLEVFIHDTLLNPPGEKFNYSTYAWTLVSAVMQMAAKNTFTDIVSKEVSRPLGISDLKPDQKDSVSYQRVSFYEFQEGSHYASPEVDNSNKWAGGGYLCSAEDLARFGFALADPGFLKDETLKTLTESQFTNAGEKTNNGIGFFSAVDDKGRKWYGHSGGSAGGTSMMLIYPEQDLVIITLVNMGSAKMDGLAIKMADIILSGNQEK